jgi:prepilin-type N-terminal cleavage/methylation domain-containing protein
MEETIMLNKMIKMRNKKGFTLMELLIVVAIIAILVAVSIPVFTSQLEKAREQTDIANMRSAKSMAVAAYLTEDALISKTASTKLYYDAIAGKLQADKPTDTYGKGTNANGGCEEFLGYTNATEATGKVIAVTVTIAGEVSEAWE